MKRSHEVHELVFNIFVVHYQIFVKITLLMNIFVFNWIPSMRNRNFIHNLHYKSKTNLNWNSLPISRVITKRQLSGLCILSSVSPTILPGRRSNSRHKRSAPIMGDSSIQICVLVLRPESKTAAPPLHFRLHIIAIHSTSLWTRREQSTQRTSENVCSVSFATSVTS